MAELTVKQSGGDYSTLATALSNANANDTISIEGEWSISDTATATVADDNITIVTDTDSKHPGYRGGSPTHYRLEVSGSHCITINNTGCEIDGLDVLQNGSGSSDECIRLGVAGTLTVKNCLLWASGKVSDQDGICWQRLNDVTVNVENSMFYGFGRAGIHPNIYSTIAGSGLTHDLNINSCSMWNCGTNSEASGGGVNAENQESDLTVYVNCYNSMMLACSYDIHDDYNEFYDNAGTVTYDIHNCIDSDGSIALRDGSAYGCLASRTIAETDQGPGTYVIVEDLDSPYDLRLQDLGNAKNNAQDMHANASGAGMNIPAKDLVDTNRPQNTNYDCGAFEVVAAGVISMPILMLQMDQFGGGVIL